MAGSHDPASGTLAPASTDQPQGDPLSDVLRAVRLTGALFFDVDASSPWVAEALPAGGLAPILLPGAQHVVSYHVLTEGSCWAEIEGEPPVQLQAGDVVIIPHGQAYALSSRPGMIGSYTHDQVADWYRQMMAGQLPVTVVEGEGGGERRRMFCGFLGCDIIPFNPVLSALPPLMLVRRPGGGATDRLSHLIDFALAEVREPRAGRSCVLLRISELMFVEVVRRYLGDLPAEQTGWLAGLRDPVVGRALALLHQQPAPPGRSRSWPATLGPVPLGSGRALHRAWWASHPCSTWRAGGCRCRRAAGRRGGPRWPPWRCEVGYDSEAAFSRAFKALVGCSPAGWRKRSRSLGRDGSVASSDGNARRLMDVRTGIVICAADNRRLAHGRQSRKAGAPPHPSLSPLRGARVRRGVAGGGQLPNGAHPRVDDRGL